MHGLDPVAAPSPLVTVTIPGPVASGLLMMAGWHKDDRGRYVGPDVTVWEKDEALALALADLERGA